MKVRLLAALLYLVLTPVVQAAETMITWHGHATFEIVTPKGVVLMIDPWLNNPVNPAAGEGKDPVAAVKRLDYILVTHGHFDHLADAVALARKTGARLVTNFELGTNMAKVLGYPKEQMGYDTLLNIGGEITIADGEVMVSLTPAVHSSGIRNPHAGEGQPDIVYGGNPTGIVLRIEGGPTIYHSGDTAMFLDMAVIGEVYEPDIALVNIGGHFGMEPAMAARAARMVKARAAVAHHYGTFPVLTQDTREFEAELKKAGVQYVPMKPGQNLRFAGRPGAAAGK